MAFDWSQWSPPQGAGAASVAAYWAGVMPSITEARQQYYQTNFYQPETALRGQYSSWGAPQWQGSPWQTQYQNEQTGMSSLLARIGGGYQPSDFSQANADVAQGYGFSPASWTALQESIPALMNATNVMTQAGNIATDMENSPFGQQQAQAMRVAERQAVDQVGMQIESIFGQRGGLGGFQAAYELTSQLQSNFMQQASQNNLAMFDRAVSAVNAQNGYYKDLIDRGAIQAQDYLKMRWDALQTGYQDYVTAMDQTMKAWQVQEQVSQQQWQAAQDNITNQINALDKQLASEMGFDDNQMTILSNIYADAAKTASLDPKTNPQAAGALVGSAGDVAIAAGLGLLAVPGMQGFGVIALVTGGLMKIGGWLLGLV